jgi:hypothetical protein
VDANKVALVGESYVSREWPQKRYQPPVPPGDGVEWLNHVLRAVTDPADVAKLKAIVEELTGQNFALSNDWREALFNHLLTNEYVLTKRPGSTSARHCGRRRADCWIWGKRTCNCSSFKSSTTNTTC